MKQLDSGSKLWWKWSHSLMDNSSQSSSILALKTQSGELRLNNAEKADLFVDTFTAKFTLPDAVPNEYTHMRTNAYVDGFLAVRARHVQRVLKCHAKSNAQHLAGHTIIMDDGTAKDSTHYTAAQLREVRWSTTGFITQEISWNEQRLQLNAIRTSLGEH